MRRTASLVRLFVWPFAGLLAAGCVVPPPAGTPRPPRVETIAADARAAAYGSTAGDVLRHPRVLEKLPSLFGSDWTPGAGPTTRLSAPASEFFSGSPALRVLRVDGTEYLSVSGCLPRACRTHRGLILIRVDGEELRARIDEGGFTHHYAYGAGMVATPRTDTIVDAAWQALHVGST